MKNCYTYLRKLMSVIAVVAITLFMISKISFLLENKTSTKNYASFFTDYEEYDVLFAGSSHVRYGFFPMPLWKDYGITSYNLAADANTLAVDYWILKQAFNYHMPKAVVLDIYEYSPNTIVSRWEHVHEAVDVYPLSMDKYKMVRDLARNPEWKDGLGNPTTTRWDLLFEFAQYHDRWSILQGNDYDSYEDLVEQSKARKGAKPLDDIASREKRDYPEIIEAEYDEIAREYLIYIIELCRANDCELVLINTGYDCSDESKLFADSVPEIAQQYGLEYIDFTQLDIIDFECDLQTGGDNTHVNASGGMKLTRYIGDILASKYHLEDHRNDASCRTWYEDYDEYAEYIAGRLRDAESFDVYLELQYGMGYDITVDIYDDSILSEGYNSPMIRNLGIDVDRIVSGTQIKVYATGNVEYGDATDSDEGIRAKVIAFDAANQNIVDEKSF